MNMIIPFNPGGSHFYLPDCVRLKHFKNRSIYNRLSNISIVLRHSIMAAQGIISQRYAQIISNLINPQASAGMIY
jgi:hypothetical protein